MREFTAANCSTNCDGRRDWTLITDFGVAGVIETTKVAVGIAGTPAYMAPELAEAAMQQKPPDEMAGVRSVASDSYSLGATLWSALTGKSPCDEQLTAKRQLRATASGHLRFDESFGPIFRRTSQNL